MTGQAVASAGKGTTSPKASLRWLSLCGSIVAVALGLLGADIARAQSYSDCKEAGGLYGDCQEPHIGPWMEYRIWGATAMPSMTCHGPFVREKDAVDCAKGVITSANMAYWCDVTWSDGQPPWQTFNSYYGWVTEEWRDPTNFVWTGRGYQSTDCIPSQQVGYIRIVRTRMVRCPATFTHWVLRPDGKAICWRLSTPLGDPENSCTNPNVGNPVRIVDRGKVLREVDYQAHGVSSLTFERRYDAYRTRDLSHVTTGFGGAWSSNFDRTLRPGFDGSRMVHRDPNGRTMAFVRATDGQWSPSPNATGRLRQVVNGSGTTVGWVLLRNVEAEEFDASGRLVQITEVHGRTLSLEYWPWGDLRSVSDQHGRTLHFGAAFDDDGAKYLARVWDPSGRSVSYFMDGASGLEQPAIVPRTYDLTSVVYQDGSNRQYRYGEWSNFVVASGITPRMTWTYNLLTSSTDELGHQVGRYMYEQSGRVLSTEGAGGVGRYSFESVVIPESTVVTDPLGTRRQYVLLRNNVQAINQPAGSGSAACSSAIAYEHATGLPTELEDFKGNLTCLQYDATRRLVVNRMEGARGKAWIGYCSSHYFANPAPGARLISTQWHPDWRLETRIAEPKKLTTIVYNGQGATCAPSTVLVDGKPPAVVCSRTEQATTDETGAAGFSATVTGVARTWSYTYTTYGRMLTATDPNGAVTIYTYHPDNDSNLGRRGNVASITNAVGHVTRITAYNAHGQPTRIIDPNNLITDLTYDLRMRLTRRKVGSETTNFVYDAAGQLTRVTLPDGARLTYTYDAAHRLTAIQDHKGNKVAYTLDAMGNRVNEKLTDPGGVLVRNIQRSIDALNRVQQVTGSSN
jgi:YD repeat-containing protein